MGCATLEVERLIEKFAADVGGSILVLDRAVEDGHRHLLVTPRFVGLSHVAQFVEVFLLGDLHFVRRLGLGDLDVGLCLL